MSDNNVAIGTVSSGSALLLALVMVLVVATLVPRLVGFAPRVERQLDELAGDPGLAQLLPGLRRQVRGQLNLSVIRPDVAVPEVLALQAALVGPGSDDLAGADLLPLADGDPVGRARGGLGCRFLRLIEHERRVTLRHHGQRCG